MVRVGISKVRDDGGYTTDEYRVYWVENGKYDEGKAAYTDDPEDAVGTLIAILERYPNASMTEARYTLDLVSRYRPDYLIGDTRRVLHEKGFPNIRGYER